MAQEDAGSVTALVYGKVIRCQLSQMLFILAMELLQLMLNKATEQGLLTPINSRKATLRTSLFADAAAILLNPVRQEVTIVKQILNSFGAALGLITNT